MVTLEGGRGRGGGRANSTVGFGNFNLRRNQIRKRGEIFV